MKALSIQQPWAHAILHCGKDVENRTWHVGHNGPLLIHASKKFDKHALPFFERQGIVLPEDPRKQLPAGGIVGIVYMTGCMKFLNSPWYEPGCYGWMFEDPHVLPFFAWQGRQGLFDFPDELLRRLGIKEELYG